MIPLFARRNERRRVNKVVDLPAISSGTGQKTVSQQFDGKTFQSYKLAVVFSGRAGFNVWPFLWLGILKSKINPENPVNPVKKNHKHSFI